MESKTPIELFKIFQLENIREHQIVLSQYFLFSGATTANLPPGVLYRVKATYKYVQEDGDELSFDVGDIINVIEYDDPEDQVRCYCVW